MGSLMEALKVRRMSASDEAEVREKNKKVRERKSVDLVVVAIGGHKRERERESSWFCLYHQSFMKWNWTE